MGTKRIFQFIASIMLLLSVASMAFAQTPSSGPERIFRGGPPTLLKPDKFTKHDTYRDTINKISYKWNGLIRYVPEDQMAGPQGIQGIPGIPGQSITGPAGPAGANGQAATITVGTTTTLPAGSSATVTNTGTSTNAVLNFGIPQGTQGPQGPAGSGGSGSFNSGRTKFVATEAEFRSAVAGIVNDQTRAIWCTQDIRITSSTGFELPKIPGGTSTNQNTVVEINLCGNSIFDNSPNGLPYVLGMQPVDQTEAMNMANRPRTYNIHGGKIVGKGTGTGYLIDLACSQRSTVWDMHLENSTNGIRMAFCMFGTIHSITSNDIRGIVVEPTRGKWPGSGNNLCSSNQFKVMNVRAFVYDGSTAIISSEACSGHTYRTNHR
jgi:hypothetical protein